MIKNPKLTRRDLLDWPKGPKTMRPTHQAGFFIRGFILSRLPIADPKTTLAAPLLWEINGPKKKNTENHYGKSMGISIFCISNKTKGLAKLELWFCL